MVRYHLMTVKRLGAFRPYASQFLVDCSLKIIYAQQREFSASIEICYVTLHVYCTVMYDWLTQWS